MGGGSWEMSSARDTSAPPVVTPVLGRRGRPGTRFPRSWGRDGTGGSAPRPRRGPRLAAGAASPPLSPAAPAWQQGFATALKTRLFPRRDRFTSKFHVAKVAFIFFYDKMSGFSF